MISAVRNKRNEQMKHFHYKYSNICGKNNKKAPQKRTFSDISKQFDSFVLMVLCETYQKNLIVFSAKRNL